jgi:hypothetical protein
MAGKEPTIRPHVLIIALSLAVALVLSLGDKRPPKD